MQGLQDKEYIYAALFSRLYKMLKDKQWTYGCCAVVAEARRFFSNVFYLKIKDLISNWIYGNISFILGQIFME